MIGYKGDEGGYTHHQGVDAQAFFVPFQEEPQAEDKKQLDCGVDYVDYCHGPEPFVNREQALERHVGNAQAGHQRGYLEHEHGIGLFSRGDVQLVMDIPEADGLQED